MNLKIKKIPILVPAAAGSVTTQETTIFLITLFKLFLYIYKNQKLLIGIGIIGAIVKPQTVDQLKEKLLLTVGLVHMKNIP